MKKLLSALLLTTALVGCSDNYRDWLMPQSGEQEAAKTIALAVTDADAINFATLNSDSVALFKPVITSSDRYMQSYNVSLYSAEKKDTAGVVANANGKVASTDLKEIVEQLYGKRPVERTIPLDIVSLTNIDGQSIRNVGQANLKVTLSANAIISDDYYLVREVNGQWQKANATMFSHSTKDVYDDPEFKLTLTTTTDNVHWYIVSKENYESGNLLSKANDGLLGVSEVGSTQTAGTLVASNPQYGSFAQAGIYQFTFNAETKAFSIDKMAYEEFVFVPGVANSWSPQDAPTLQSANHDGVYTGFAYLQDGFKLTKKRNWNEGEYNYYDFTTYPEGFTSDGSNIKAPSAGYYYITADVANKTFQAEKVSWGLVGSAIGSWDNDIDMTFVKVGNKEAFQVTTDLVVGEMKFRANDDWKIDLGGKNLNELILKGGNISIAKAGKYKITLYPSRNANDTKYYCTIEEVK